jgi:hypothetical protein
MRYDEVERGNPGVGKEVETDDSGTDGDALQHIKCELQYGVVSVGEERVGG